MQTFFYTFLHTLKVEESCKIRQETYSVALSVNVDNLDRSSDTTWSYVSLVNSAGQGSLPTHIVSGQLPTPNAPQLVSFDRGGVKTVTNMLKSVSKMCKPYTKAVQQYHSDSERPVCHRELVRPQTARPQATFLPPNYMFMHMWGRYPRFKLAVQCSITPARQICALAGSKNAPRPPEIYEGGEPVLQDQNKGGQGEGMGRDADSGGDLGESDGSGASGGGAGDDGEDNRIITQGELGETDKETSLVDSSPFQETVPENCSEQLPRTSASDVDTGIVKDANLDEFVPGMNLPRNPVHSSLPDANLDEFVPGMNLPRNPVHSSLPDANLDEFVPGMNLPRNPVHSSLPDANLDEFVPGMNLPRNPVHSSLPDANLDEFVPGMNLPRNPVHSSLPDANLDEFVPGINLPRNRDHPSLPDDQCVQEAPESDGIASSILDFLDSFDDFDC